MVNRRRTTSRMAHLAVLATAAVLGALSMVGCQSRIFSYEGKPVAGDRQIKLLEGGPHNGLWEGTHVTVDYQYERGDQVLKISGKAVLERRAIVDRFNLSVHFIDGQGNIATSRSLVSAGSRKPRQTFRFDSQLSVAPDTSAMVFSYGGAKWGVGDTGGGVQEFWQRP